MKYFQNIFARRSILAIGMAVSLCLWYAGCSKSADPISPPTTPADLVLQSRAVTTAETFTATNSITVGPSFTVANGGSATFVTRSGLFYFRPGFTIVGGGRLMTIKNPGLAKIPTN